MKGLSYLFWTTAKNAVKEFFKSPSKIILTVFMVLLMGMLLFTPSAATLPGHQVRDIKEAYAMVLSLYMGVFLVLSYHGFGSGASFYSMADVGLLFSTPIPPRKILMFGLLKQMGTSLLVGFFLLFQYGWLRTMYGIDIGFLFAVLLGYGFVMFCGQLTAMAIYILTSSSDRKKMIAKGIFFLFCGVTALLLIVPLLGAEITLPRIIEQVNQPVFSLLPVFGWMQGMVTGILGGSLISTFAYIGATILYIGAFIFIMMRSHPDFYEDVLHATEVSFSAITAKKEGKINDNIRRNVKVGKIGLGHGKGSGVFFFKHMLENRRGGGLFFIDGMTLIFDLICIIYAFFLRSSGILPILIFATYMQIFSSTMGRWVRELTSPYVYMIPEKPFKKLMMLCRENILRIIFEAVVLIIPVGLILELKPVEYIACIVARIGFGFLFMAGNVLVQRIFGGVMNRVLIMTMYFLVMIGISLPGIVCAVIVTMGTAAGLSVSLFVTFGWNLFAGLIILFCCRNVLYYAELNNR